MPTATPFVYPKLFSPGAHCVEDKTTAQLDALNLCRYEDTLENILSIWWNLYTIEITIQFSGKSSQTKTSIAAREGQGGSISDIEGESEATPVLRVCARYDSSAGTGTTYINALSDPFADGSVSGENTYLVFTLRRVYYNTSTNKYALVFSISIDGGPSGPVFYGSNAGAVANGGTVTILGQTTYSGTHPSGAGYPDVDLTISNPVYYTY